MTSKVQPAADYWAFDRKKPGDEIALFMAASRFTSAKLLKVKHIFSFKSLKIFWMNNKAIIEFDLSSIWRILQISENVITLFDLQNSASVNNC